MSQPQPPQRELVFCHECENEWYRDEHGIICPECQSDFTECIGPDHDPREEDMDLAPDPDEEDIGQFEWTDNAPGEPPGGRLHGHIHRTITLGLGQDHGAGAVGGLLGILGPAIQGMLRNAPQQHGQAPPPPPTDGEGDFDGDGARPATASPYPNEQQHGNSGTFSGSGPGYAYTITSNANLHPRDAGMPQPVRTEAVDIGTIMQRMIANIGIAPVHGAAGHPPAGIGLQGNSGGIEDLLAMFSGAGHTGVHGGDAVYSQQEYDRVISRFMEQHAAEQAPPRASEEAIDALPRRQITEEDFGDAAKAECSICIGKVDLGEEVTVLPCQHWFHHECVKPWLSSHDTCPHCRKGIMPKDDANGNWPRDAHQAPNHDMNSQGSQQPHNPDQAPRPNLHTQGSQQPSFAGMFNQMREAFGPGSNAMGGGNAASGGGSAAGNDATSTHPANDE